MGEETKEHKEESEEEFGELLKYTASGFVGGLIVAAVFDSMGLQRSAVGQWIVRTLAGEGESILEGFYALRQRVRGSIGSMAEAYGWGKFFGMMFPWIIDWGSRFLGINVYGVESFYIPFFYAMSDQIGANISGFIFLHRQAGSLSGAITLYLRHPVMLTSLVIVLAVPAGLLIARLIGFSPTTQILTALETVAANLCWMPPFVGWLMERKQTE
jgi:hypothetical protein